MGNPTTTTACTVQVAMTTLSKRRHRQTLSLQLEQVGHLERCESMKKKPSASLESSPRVTEEKAVAAFLAKQAPGRKVTPSSLGTSGSDVEKVIEVSRAHAESDRKPASFNPFRGHKRADSGSIIISPSKSLESTPRLKSGSLSFRKESGGSASFRKDISGGGSASFRKEGGGLSASFRKEVGGSGSFRREGGSFRKEVGGSSSFRKEVGGSGSFRKESGGSGSFRKESGGSFRKEGSSSSFRKDRSSAIAKIAASLFHSPTKLERSMSMSRLAHKAIIPEEVVSLRQKFQRSSDDAILFPQTHADSCKKSNASDTSVKDIEESARPLISTATSSQQHECVIGTPKDLIKGQEELLIEDPKDAPASTVLEKALHPESTNSSYVWTKHHDFSPRLPTENYCSPLALSECNSEEAAAAVDISPSLDHQLLFTTVEKVTEEELTEAAVLSSLMSEEYLTSPVFLSSEKHLTPIFSPSTMSETGVRRSPCDSDACLKKCMSFEPVARDKTKAGEGGDRKAAKLRKRRRSVSASGIGAMLLKVVRVSDSGPIITRRLPKVGPEVISGAEALRAREYVLQKTAQISMGRVSESSSPASARLVNGACQCDNSSDNAVTKSITYSDKFVDAEVGSGAGTPVSSELFHEAHQGVDATGCEDKQATSESRRVEVMHLPEMELDTMSVAGGSCRREGPASSFRVERVSSNLQQQRQQKPNHVSSTTTVAPANTPSAGLQAAENVDDSSRRGWKPKKKTQRSRGRSSSYDFDSLAECPAQAETDSLMRQGAALSTLDANVAISRERSRSFVSRLQAPGSATASSVDIFRLAPSSISILANPSFSSSHQDRLWEEQAEAYSSGGRGTPGRDDEPPPPPPPLQLLHSPSPSSEDHQVPTGSLRRESGKEKKKLGKRGRPDQHTPLRSLLADDVKSSSPDQGGHFLHQIMSRIRGGSSKSVSPKSRAPEDDVGVKRRNTWSSCICFSTK